MAHDSALDDTQALSGDKDPVTWSTHPIDIRISLPFMRRRFYFTVVAGQERRRGDRLRQDRAAYPLVKAGNVLFTLGITTLITFAALLALIAQSAIIE